MARDIRQSMTVIRISTVEDFAELGLRWRDLEQRSAGSFFQSWTWMGCLVAQRFPDPILVEASEDGRVVALALFNRVQRWIGPALLYLGESGNAELDCPYIEQNGVLTEVGREEELTAQCLTRLMSSYDVVLSGIGGPVLAAIHRIAGLVAIRRAQASPFVDLRRLRETGADYLTERSANTRQQVRRSDRFYERSGPIMIQQAELGCCRACHAGRNGDAASDDLDGARAAWVLCTAIFSPVPSGDFGLRCSNRRSHAAQSGLWRHAYRYSV